jgi:hypothetical protein
MRASCPAPIMPTVALGGRGSRRVRDPVATDWFT